MSKDDHKDSDNLSPEQLLALIGEAECQLVDMDILAMMSIVKAQLLAARENPCCETITDAVNGHDIFLDELRDQEPFDQYLLSTHIERQLPPEWPLWVNFTRNFLAQYYPSRE